MVLSEIDRSVEYKEKSSIDMVDNDMNSLIYPIEYGDGSHIKKYKITFGRKNHELEKSHKIIYYPVYLVVKGEVKSKIGVLEVEKDLHSKILDTDGDIDVEKMPELLLFSFVNEKFLEAQSDIEVESDSDVSSNDDTEEEDEDSVVIIKKESKTDHDDLFEVDIDIVPSNGEPKTQLHKNEQKESVFKDDVNYKMPVTLTEESKKDAEKVRNEFQESSRNEWIENFMKNNMYKIVDNEGSGDCLFAVIRDAFRQIGQITTVEKLRDILSEEATDEIFQEYRIIYLSMENEIKENEKEIKSIVNELKTIKKRIKENPAIREQDKKYILDAKKLNETRVKLEKENKENNAMLQYEFGFMKDLDSLSKFKEFIKTSRFWADHWAISTLEEKLNFKFIIFSEESFEENSLDSVINCGDSTNEIRKRGVFKPNHYILTSYSGLHYRLITYKDKRIFDYREIPYDVKMLIMNKCMERNAGVFDLIPDFRNLKSKIGITTEPDENDYEMDGYMSSLFNPEIIFVLGESAPSKKEPGTAANGERIPLDKKSDYIKLRKIPDWRRKLHDSWTDAPFSLDGHRWASVEHYYQASKFKKQHPDYYVKFSLDHPSDLSQKVEIAKLAGSKEGKKYRDKKYASVTIDPDFYGGRNLEERARAIEAKFEQNEDLRQVLLMTTPAKLMDFVRRSKSEMNEPLMSLRRKYQE
jgi:hypothetical protein